MRPIYGCPEKFESLSTHTATIVEIFHGLLFRSILSIYVRTKFEVRTYPIPGGTQKIGHSLDTPTHPFLPNF